MTRTSRGSDLDLRNEVNLLFEVFEAVDLKESLFIVAVVDDIIMLVDAVIDDVLSNTVSSHWEDLQTQDICKHM